MASAETGTALDAECLRCTVECDQCQKSLVVVFDREEDERYKNWIHATLCIQYTKEALEPLVEDVAKQMHAEIKPVLSNAGNCTCKLEDFKKDKRICKICTEHKKELLKQYNGTNESFKWKVSLTVKQINESEINLVQLFSHGRFEGCHNLKEADCAAFLFFLGSTVKGLKALNGGTYLSEVRMARNKLMHSGTMKIEPNQLEQYGNSCLAFLENINHPSEESKERADEKREKIKKIIDKEINIGFVQAEKIAMDHHNSHAKVEIETLQREIESGDHSTQQLRKKKEKLLKFFKDRLLQMCRRAS